MQALPHAQVEVSFPSDRNRSSTTRWIPAVWGCVVPLHDIDKALQQGRVPFELGFAATDVASPLSLEPAAAGNALIATGVITAEVEIKVSAIVIDGCALVRWSRRHSNDGSMWSVRPVYIHQASATWKELLHKEKQTEEARTAAAIAGAQVVLWHNHLPHQQHH